VPPHELLVDYIEKNYINNLTETFGYTSLLAGLVARHPVKNWRDATDVFAHNNFESNNDTQLCFAPGVTQLFPELIEILNALPYKQIFGAMLSLHTNYLAPHNDMVDTTGASSPERYNVLLSPHYGQNSFFICKDVDSPRNYPIILEDYPIYAFNNKDIYHGADTVLDRRIIMICGGIIDEEQHQILIARSAEKFKDYVIQY
jgi:hypothetical protein